MLARISPPVQYPRAMGGVLLLILASSAICYYLGGRFYGRYLARSIGVNDARPTPAIEKNDGRDFIPSKPYVLFAHHFAAIAGAGPIVGPTLAMAYGYVPALLWVVLGAIFLGGVHDMTTLYMSVREEGRSVADIARDYLGTTGYILIISFLVIGLFMITATFLNLSVTALTSMYPAEKVGMAPVPVEKLSAALATEVDPTGLHPFRDGSAMPTGVTMKDGQPVLMAKIGGIASTSVLFITLCAPLLGIMIYKIRTHTVWNYLLAAVLCLLSVVLGLRFPMIVSPDTWRILMSVYVVLASAIPVWLLLMPRDFVNVQILYGGIFAVVAGLLVAGFGGGFSSVPAAPQSVQETIPLWDAENGMKFVGMLWPMLFITVSCGAISGFHCLVSSGTSAKQLSNERDARTVGFHAMLLESTLAVTVILTLLIGLDWKSYLGITYGEKNPILAISLATGNLVNLAFGLPVWAGAVLGILLLEGFVVTTLDVAVRLNRYLLEEVWAFLFKNPPRILRNVWFNTGLCVGIMFLLSRSNTLPVLWQVFGSANQMMGAMALLVVSVWLRDHGRRYWFALVPAIIMFATTFASTGLSLVLNFGRANWPLVATCAVLLGLGIGVAVIGTRVLMRQSRADAAG
ncbi:MAG: carbon starvation protein A [Terrimicrobiaceae bacterium]